MKLSNKHKAAIKSYLRAVAASGITVALAIVADIHPAYATLLGAIIAPIVKAQGYIDTINYPSNGLVLGVIRALDNINRNNGAGYLNGTFKNVNLTGGSGTGAKGDFTVIGGQVSSFDITSGGPG